MKMNDAVLAIAVSPNGKHIAVALADGTVKVYYMDSHKFFLSLYGHKLPVSCLDISTDEDLLSIFAHAASVRAVKFVRNTHYVFSVGNDRLVKYWDADKFELLLTLDGHHDKVCCLAISNRGDFLVTGSFDRSIRRWDRTAEPFFIEEEKEKRLEEMFESDIENLFEDKSVPKEEIPEEGVVRLAGKTTQETLSGSDSIIEALDMADAEIKRLAEHETNDLELTLLALPFSDALKLLSHLKDWATIPDKVELVGRVATLLLQLHCNQLVSTVAAKPVLTSLKDIIPARVKECKDSLGFNLAAMDHLKQLMALRSDAPFRDAKSKLLEIRSQIAQ
ncbi:hypothetical protein Leryth_026104 [Lithospermum erythrorhizon]|nr:hypothetical protein Leryth_026104 [Lithospermum erythrorhizon]